MGFFGRRKSKPAPTRGSALAPVPSLHVTERKAECAVCFDPLADPSREVVALRCATGTTCGHYLHRDCAQSWRQTTLASDRSCPICRTPFQELVTFPSIDNARAWFDFVDADGDGSLTQREVAGALKASIPDLDTDTFDRELPQLWQRWDKDGDGTISYHELFAADGLLAYARSRRGGTRDGEPPPLSQPDQWFSFWDYDGSGDLTKNELRRALSKTFGLTGDVAKIGAMGETLDACWGVFDTDGSGAIDRAEFSQPGGLGETLAASLGDYTPPPSQPGAFAASASSMAHAAALTNTPAATGPAYVNMPPVASAPPAGPGSYVVDGTPVVQATIVQAAPVVQSAPAVDPPPTYLPPQWEERIAPDGRPYYVNHQTQTTQWHPP